MLGAHQHVLREGGAEDGRAGRSMFPLAGVADLVYAMVTGNNQALVW
jgi:hypothetical protein